MQETCVWYLGWEDPMEKDMATYSSILAWESQGLTGHSPKGCKELDMNEWLTLSFYFISSQKILPFVQTVYSTLILSFNVL